MKVERVFCLFEQSGTFKNAFKALGIDAEDYDILNDFGETDHQIDLFKEIDNAYEKKSSLFDKIGSSDLCLAFFPCTRFEDMIPVAFRGQQPQQSQWSDSKKLEYSMGLHKELHEFYVSICKLFLISLRGGWRLIVENPYSRIHYLTQFFPVAPKIIIRDRNLEGDYYRKPTQFYFINCEPEQNVVFEPIEQLPLLILNGKNSFLQKQKGHRQIIRSQIHPQFADRFIKTYILDKDGGVWME